MIGNDSIDFSLINLTRTWYRFRRGKHASREIDEFSYYLEDQLADLHQTLSDQSYQHGPYRRVTITDNKRRDLAVATVRDRVVHRLLYDYLVKRFDPTFIYDAWSCRKGKGLLGAIERAQAFASRYPNGWVWRSDIKKFFDHVDQDVLKQCLRRRVEDPSALWLLDTVIDSYAALSIWPASNRERERERERELGAPRQGIPIGNLTSQIFANIYLGELDRFVVHTLKPQAYLRYGDDFTLFVHSKEGATVLRERVIRFCRDELRLIINPKQDVIVPIRRGIFFLGVEIFPSGHRLRKRHWRRIQDRLNLQNVASYRELIARHNPEKLPWFNWLLKEKLLDQFD